jgi:hypothetical protein
MTRLLIPAFTEEGLLYPDTPSRSQNLDTVMPDAVNCCNRRCHANDFRGSVGRAMSRLLENGLKSVNPRGYQGGQEWLWWALTNKSQDIRGVRRLEQSN